MISQELIDTAMEKCKEIGLCGIVQLVEEALICEALIRTGDNAAAAARLLGLQRTTLLEKRKKLGFRIGPAGRVNPGPSMPERYGE